MVSAGAQRFHGELLKDRRFRWLLATLLVVAPLEVLSFFSIHLPSWIEFPLFFVIMILFGRRVFMSGFRSLFQLDFSNINLLMTVAIFGATYLREFEEAVIIVVLFALGDTLEEFGIARSQTALQGLMERSPKSAELKGKEEKVPIEEIRVGEVIVIRPGDQIPLDGEVIVGSSLIDEAAITGEPLPVSKDVGDRVYAGTVNAQGYLEVKATKEAKDSTLSKIIELTYRSVEMKSMAQRFIEKFAKIYTPSVVCASFLLVVIPVLFMGKPFNPWLARALVLLIIACPCALVISTPITIFSAIGNASQKGALIKGGRFIEEMGRVKAIAFDKTRTLTRGEPIVTDVIPFNGLTEEEVIACAAGMEAFSEHPLARSIQRALEGRGLQSHRFVNFQAIPGKGIRGECTVCFDKHHCLGKMKFVTEEHPLEEEALKRIEEFEKQGKTTIVLSDRNGVKGILGVTDEMRKESKPVIEDLLRSHLTPVILTGDNKSSAEFVARQLGIDIVKAELLPDKKVEELLAFLKEYRHIAMVGDGVNDAPALASASVGIAMGAVGSDVAIENADIALMNDNLNLVPYLVGLGRRCLGTIRLNIAAALLVKFSFLFLATGGLSNLALAIFADVGVTVLVILNGLRIYRHEEAKAFPERRRWI